MLERTSHHEAGHAVVACLFNIPLFAVTVAPGPRDSSGGRVMGNVQLVLKIPKWANPWLPEFDHKRGRQYIARNICMTLAGVLAETLHTRCWQQTAEHEGTDDESLAHAVALPLHSTPKATRNWVNRLRFQTLETLRAPDVWAAVDAVARELVQRNTLTGAEVRALVKRRCRRRSPAAFPPSPAKFPAR